MPLVANVHRTVAITQKGSTSVPKLLSLTRANLRSPYRSNPRFCTSASMKRLNIVKSKVDIPWLLDRSSRTNNSIETREHVSACGRRCNATSSTTSITPPIHNLALPISDGHIPETSPACGPSSSFRMRVRSGRKVIARDFQGNSIQTSSFIREVHLLSTD